MKKITFNYLAPIFLGLIAIFIIGSSCGGFFGGPNVPVDPATCNESMSDLKKLTEILISNKEASDGKYDLLVHQMTINVSEQKTICKIGYQGNANLFTANLPYTIEIVRESDNTVLYTGNHVFNSNAIQYVSVNLMLQGKEKYTIKRKLLTTGVLNDKSNAIGRALIPSKSFTFPISTANYSIVQTAFYNTSPGPIANQAIPYIDIIFEN